MNKGVLYALLAYILWGIYPIYWKQIQKVPATEILAHRFVWSFLFLGLVLLVLKEWPVFSKSIRNRKTLIIYTFAACLLAVNWLVYIWGINAGFIVETSLGYFINPLVNVLLGVLILREKIRLSLWIPISIAAIGVIYLTISYGRLPWIALVLAFTFGFYGLVTKTAPLNALYGLTLETAIMIIPASAALVLLEYRGSGSLGHSGVYTNFLLLFVGPMTAVPLLLFGAAARKINLSVLGILQYLAPTLQFLIGVLVYHEPFTRERFIGFSIIWLALVVFWIESFLSQRRVNLAIERS